MRYALVLSLLALVGPAAFAQPTLPPPRVAPQVSDFELRLPMRISGDNGVVQLLLPQLVYERAQTAGLGDLRVFNAAGESVPYAVLPPRQGRQAHVRFRDSVASLYPIHGPANAALPDLKVEVEAAPDGSLLAIRASHPAAGAPEQRLRALIVDVGNAAADERLEGLRLIVPEQTIYRATLAIDRSDDLKLWDTVAQSNVDWLSGTAQERLVNDRIDMPSSRGRYLRLRWLEGEPIGFTAVEARWRLSTVAAEQTGENHYQIVLQGEPGRWEGDYVYHASPAIAATEIGVDLPQANSVVPISIGDYLGSKAGQAGRFEARLHNTFYRITQNGTERISSRMRVMPMAAAQWVLRSSAAELGMPALVLRWQPQTLVFTARGNGPFVLAVGASSAVTQRLTGGSTAIAQVAPGFSSDELLTLEQARIEINAPITPAQPRAVATTDNQADRAAHRRYLLWTILVSGVLVLAVMSLRLYRQLGAESTRVD